ncbi:MAG: hypothetical protein WCL44_13190 [bacterium]
MSEFIAPESLKCPNCAAPLVLDKTTVLRDAASRLTVRREKPPDPRTATPAASKRNGLFRRRRRLNKVRKVGKVSISDFTMSWVLFLTLTPVLCLLRYVTFLSATDLADYIYYGQVMFAVFYLVIIVTALSDDMFEGILCIFLPPYTAYYLFARSDSFSLRALVASLVAAFGYDVAVTSYEAAVSAIDAVQKWIGGGALGY